MSLRDISHLFLSDVRAKHTNGAPRPVRTPPGQARADHTSTKRDDEHPKRPIREHTPLSDESIDMTPNEFARAFGGEVSSEEEQAMHDECETAPVNILLANHLTGRQLDRACQYARSLAAREGRVGMMVVDSSELRLMCFEAGDEGEVVNAEPVNGFDVRTISEALEEMSWDVRQWLVLLPHPRTTEARNLLRAAGNWTLLSTTDHDGVVACYRSLKGLSDIGRPTLSLAVLDATDDEDAVRVHGKLSSVLQQFLHWNVEPAPMVCDEQGVVEHTVMLCRGNEEKALHWKVVGDFIASRTQPHRIHRPQPVAATSAVEMNAALQEETAPVDHITGPSDLKEIAQPVKPATPVAAPVAQAAGSDETDADVVIDITDANGTAGSIISALLTHESGRLVECPVIRPPSCPEARLAVTLDHGLELIAMSESGLSNLRAIGVALQWLVENRSLVAMALPQLNIDAMKFPRLRLLVDHNDASAQVLQPMLHSGIVTLQSYRKLKWGQKTGLLLAAA